MDPAEGGKKIKSGTTTEGYGGNAKP